MTETCASFPGTKSRWEGYNQSEFEFDGRQCRVVSPRATATGKPWIWRARFWGTAPGVDLALLGCGFHVAYIDVVSMFGGPRAVAHWDAFYRRLTGQHGFAEKPALEGMSRGGLIVYNWAKRNPDKVACIYGDAPVCDFKSWPGKNPANEMWTLCREAYGFSEEEARAFKDNPIDNLEPLAEARVPVIHVCGAKDESVPMPENTDILAARYRALGGEITVIVKEDCGHHPHGLEDPTPVVEFILQHTGHAVSR